MKLMSAIDLKADARISFMFLGIDKICREFGSSA